MRLKLLCASLAAMSLTACATVDMTSMAGTTSISAQQTSPQGNVVERAASKLYAVFVNKGWAAKASRKRVQSTANVLLKGLEPTVADMNAGSYADTATSYASLSSDIRAAQQHVDQTVKAAEVYLAMSDLGVNMRAELSSLEKALITSRQAEVVFSTALERLNRTDCPDFASYAARVNALRDVTDEYGQRVRQTSSPLKTAGLG
ncbi:hypothetical protein [Fretibacter rubidus]|uniref:hypothetical protein n=1 Tax=Fretibacter rubidus TaxID=570162 RepID=UPI00352AA12F